MMSVGSLKIYRTIFLASIFRLATSCPPSCPPGTHCSSEKVCCVKCETGTFQDKETNSSSCRDCRTDCGQKQERIQECNALEDLLCQCKDGYYLGNLPVPYGTCELHKKCDSGYGVEIPGNHLNDTVCKPCREDQFSEKQSSTEPCLYCTKCSKGEEVLHQCTPKSDRQCKPTDCGQFETPDHGSFYKHNGTTYQSKVTFTCDTGYLLRGFQTIYCLSSGNWTGTPPSCVAPDSYPGDGVIIGISISAFFIGCLIGSVIGFWVRSTRRCAKGNVNGQAEDSILHQNSDKPNETQEDEIPDTSQTEMDIENEQNDSEQGETETFIARTFNQGSSGKDISLAGKRRGQQTNRSKNNPMQEKNIGNRNNPHPIRQPQPMTTAV